MTDNATKKAARQLQRETGISYTRALAQVTGQRPGDIAGSLTTEMLQELLNIAPGSGLDVAKLWREHSLPVGTGAPVVMDHLLRVPIGFQLDKTPVFLDFKDQADAGKGPHGLIIGRTGLGRTATLQTIALGLLTQHPPEVVRALYIDAFAGGALDDFADWPHVERLVVTDRSALDRCGDRLRDLLRERANQLAEAGRQVKGEPFTLREYTAARATSTSWGLRLPPMPFMFIIADDFPSLLGQSPSLRGSFDAVARYGWQLGLVLLLGSQTGGAEAAPREWEIGYRIDLNATAGQPRGCAHFVSSPDAEPVKYQGFHVPRKTLRAVGRQVPGQRATDAAKNAARKIQRDTGVSYTRALRHATNAHTPTSPAQPAGAMLVNRIPRWQFFGDLWLWIDAARDHLNDAIRPARDTYHLTSRTAEASSVGGKISSLMCDAGLLLHEAGRQIHAASDSFRESGGKDDVLIPAPAVIFAERYGDAEHFVLADSEQPVVHTLRAIFDGVSYQAWVDRFGPPNSNNATEWVLRTMAGPATIYRPELAADQAIPLTDVATWHLGGYSDKMVWLLQSCLIPDVQFTIRGQVWSVEEGPSGGLNLFSQIAYRLDEASQDLRDVLQGLEADWTPAGTELPAAAAAARSSVAGLIERVQAIVDEASELARPLLEGYRQAASQ